MAEKSSEVLPSSDPYKVSWGKKNPSLFPDHVSGQTEYLLKTIKMVNIYIKKAETSFSGKSCLSLQVFRDWQSASNKDYPKSQKLGRIMDRGKQ